MGIPTKPPTFRTLDWAAEVRRIWADDWHKRDTAYEFANANGRDGRKFDDSGDGSGIYAGTHGGN